MSEYHLLKFSRRHLINRLHVLSRKLLNGWKTLALRSIRNRKQDQQCSCTSGSRSHDKTPLPAESAHNKTCQNKGYELSEIRTCTEDAVECAPSGLREPSGQAYDSRRRTHGLHPAVKAPQYSKEEEYDGQRDCRISVYYSENSHKEIDGSRNRKAGEHETADIAIVRNEAVQELAHRIDKQQSGAYDTQLTCRKEPFINKRLLDHTQAHPADIVQTIRDSNPPESPVSDGKIPWAYFILGNGLPGRLAYPVE